MQNSLMPVLAQREDMRIVEVDGQPVVTARDLARALEYNDERSVHRIYNRSKDGFRERRSQFDSTPHDTGVVNLTTPSGEQQVRYFTKRGALKIIMKSNQPRAVAVQEALIDLYEQVERGELVSMGYLQDTVRDLRLEINRLRGLLPEAREIQKVLYVPQRCKPRSFDAEALAFLEKLFISKPYAKVVELDRQLRDEAARQGWKVGASDSVYRTLKRWRMAAKGSEQ